MIAVVLLVLASVLAVATPWRRLPVRARFWTAAVLLNTAAFFSMPVMPATSPWRPVVARCLAVGAILSFLLFLLGLSLQRRQDGGISGWTGLLILCVFPAVLYAFFWLIGPLY